MSVVAFDPNNWLLTCTRSIGSYVEQVLSDPDTSIEMSFPDVRNWEKETPLAKSLIHFETDDVSDPPIGFGKPGKEFFDNTDPANPKFHVEEAAQHFINYDVGVWTSAESGGATKRMVLKQALKDMFVTVTGKEAMYAATGGIWAISFEGGRDELDRINDLPVWRALDMTLIVRVFSRHVPASLETVALDFAQDQDLTIVSADGSNKPVTTP